MIRSLAFNLYFYTLTVLAALLGIVLVPIPTPVLLRSLLLEPPPSVVGHTGATEQLSHDDRLALERLMRGNAAH